ncbi:MAG TPA: hypothetical protein VIT88_03810 [Pyrinomonadaceae bacterium]
MTTKLRTLVTSGCALVLLGISLASTMGQQVQDEARQHPAVIQYKGDMANILAVVATRYDRTIGLEVDPRQSRTTVDFYLKEPTLSDVMNAITKSSVIYRWSDGAESIEVIPLGGGSPLLDTHITSFRVDYADEGEAIVQLVNLPEVQASMNAMRLQFRERVNGLATNSGKKMSFTLKNVTVRQVLNRIANESGTRFWMMHRNGAGFISISTEP